MHLFDLAPELIELLFESFIRARDLARAMRLRLVSRQFKDCVDDAFFRLRYLHQLVGKPYQISELLYGMRHTGRDPARLAYVTSYLAYQARRERFSLSRLGRVYRAAQFLCEQDGKLESEAIATYLEPLVRLMAEESDRGAFLAEASVQWLECSEEDLSADIYVASAYLGQRAYVERLIAEGIQFCGARKTDDMKSQVFGSALRAVLIRGDVEMITLVLSCLPDYKSRGIIEPQRWCDMFPLAGSRAASHFFLDDRSGNSRIPDSPDRSRYRLVLETGMTATQWPDVRERLATFLAQMNGSGDPERSQQNLAVRLSSSATLGHTEMVQYWLQKGATPNHAEAHRDNTAFAAWIHRPLLNAIENRHEKITRNLLDAGADPNWYPLYGTALMAAARAGRLSMAKLLLDRGALVNEGYPPPIVMAVFQEHLDMFRLLRQYGARLDTPETGGWAMAVATSHGLRSMVELLVQEGVGEDVILHWGNSKPEAYGAYDSYLLPL